MFMMMMKKLAVSFEENSDCSHEHKLKFDKDLAKEYLRRGWIKSKFAIEIRCYGFLANSILASLANLEFID